MGISHRQYTEIGLLIHARHVTSYFTFETPVLIESNDVLRRGEIIYYIPTYSLHTSIFS